ncbi:MAG: four helix bundle protein [Gammaproteobacteria bacterium]
MARYEHLPIYKQAMDLTIYCEQIVRNFSRYHKYTLGSELRQKSRENVGLIIKANSTGYCSPFSLCALCHSSLSSIPATFMR